MKELGQLLVYKHDSKQMHFINTEHFHFKDTMDLSKPISELLEHSLGNYVQDGVSYLAFQVLDKTTGLTENISYQSSHICGASGIITKYVEPINLHPTCHGIKGSIEMIQIALDKSICPLPEVYMHTFGLKLEDVQILCNEKTSWIVCKQYELTCHLKNVFSDADAEL